MWYTKPPKIKQINQWKLLESISQIKSNRIRKFELHAGGTALYLLKSALLLQFLEAFRAII